MEYSRSPFLEVEQSLLVLIDVQDRLAPQIANHASVVARCRVLLQGARAMGVPVLATEHCAEAIGPTLPTLRALLEAGEIIAKRTFSAMGESALPEALRRCGCRQVLLAGMEAHVCVLQTALGVVDAGYECWVVADAIGSRHGDDRLLAIERLREAGARVVSSEMVLFEWLGGADHPQFRTLIPLIKTM